MAARAPTTQPARTPYNPRPETYDPHVWGGWFGQGANYTPSRTERNTVRVCLATVGATAGTVIAAEIAAAAAARGAAAAITEAAGTMSCFLAGTSVLLGDGKTGESIESVRVGERVATDGGVANSPDGRTRAADPDATAVDPKTWRLVTLEIDARANGGGVDVMRVQELMPLSTLRAEHAKAGGHIPLPLDLGDINEVGVGAVVESIAVCPRSKAAPAGWCSRRSRT